MTGPGQSAGRGAGPARGATVGGVLQGAMRALWRAGLDRVSPGRVEARARAAALAALATAQLAPLAPLTQAARHRATSGGAGGGWGGAWSDTLPSVLLDDEVLTCAARAARCYVHAEYHWSPGGLTDRSGGAWPGADGGVAPTLDPEVERALRHDLLAVALARLVVREETPKVESLDLRALSGLGAANDRAYPSLAAFGDEGMLTRAAYRAQNEGREPGIAFETPADYAAALAGLRRRLSDEPWTVYCRAWDDRLFLSNGDGAHHLAAVHRYCREQDVALHVWAHVGRVYLDPRAAEVVDRFAVWRVAPATYEALAAALAPPESSRRSTACTGASAATRRTRRPRPTRPPRCWRCRTTTGPPPPSAHAWRPCRAPRHRGAGRPRPGRPGCRST